MPDETIDYPAHGGDQSWGEMSLEERDNALLTLVSQLATVTECQGEALAALEDRVTTLELAGTV